MPCNSGDVRDGGDFDRRQFLRSAAAAGALAANSSTAATNVAPPPTLAGATHVVVDDSPTIAGGRFGIRTFGRDEVALIYARRTRGDVVLRRSLDGGRSWNATDDSIVWTNPGSDEERAKFLVQDSAARDVLDMRRPEALFYFGRTTPAMRKAVTQTHDGYVCRREPLATSSAAQTSEASRPVAVFQLRSIDRGRTWETIPLVLDGPSRSERPAAMDNYPLTKMPDGSFVGTVLTARGLWLYGTECDGLTWQSLSLITSSDEAAGLENAGSILSTQGAFQAYYLTTSSTGAILCVKESVDGYDWSEPRRLLDDCEQAWPLRLVDGSLIVLFTRRGPVARAALIASRDDSRTWSVPVTIRDAAAGEVFGTVAAVQLETGDVFAAYQRCNAAADASQATFVIDASRFRLT